MRKTNQNRTRRRAQALETQHGGVRARVCVDKAQFGAVGTLLLDAA